ncbi:MAG: hypothetical protein LUG12_04885 [Erysipelotrichaceae bacterium]|nr:hypothetical protein [Erysipelotrichaceae bacterium]
MKVLFLDIDGVLQPYQSRYRFHTNLETLIKYLSLRYQRDYTIYDKYIIGACFLDWNKKAVKRIKTILDATNAKIVISSGWRSKKYPNRMLDLLHIWDMDQYWIGETDFFHDNMIEAQAYLKSQGYHLYERQVEILDYLFTHQDIKQYVIVDDMYFENVFDGHFVKTYNLIKNKQVEECIRILNS